MADFTLHYGLDWAMISFYSFTLVLVRISGLMIVGPVFGQPVVPINVRILLAVALSLLITPAVTVNASHFPSQLPATLLDYMWVAFGELALGFAIGLGVMSILSGLQMAGQLIDQQIGLALGEVFSPSLDIVGSVSGQLLFRFGVIIILLMEPFGGHVLMLSALLETFQTFPVGEATISASTVDLLSGIVHQSLVLAVQLAAPLLATMSLVALAMGFLGHTVPQINILVVGFSIRALVSLLILALSLSGVAMEIVDVVPRVIDEIRIALSSL